MISFSVFFWTFIVLFALIGVLRGWGKELLVMFSLILALSIIQLIQAYVPSASWPLASGNPQTQFFLWSAVIAMFALSGYHIPGTYKLTASHSHGHRLQDRLLGGIIGACNGYLLIGTIWFYLDMTNYPFSAEHMTPPGDAAQKIVALLPPAWLNVPEIYFALAIACTILVVVFI